MGPLARREYVSNMQGRYRQASKRLEKSTLLTEVVGNLGAGLELRKTGLDEDRE